MALTKGDVGLGSVDNTTDAAKPVSTAQATADGLRVLKAGDTMSGNLTIPNGTIAGHAVNKGQLDGSIDDRVAVAGDVMTGALGMSSQQIYGLANGTAADHAVNKGQLDAVSTAQTTADALKADKTTTVTGTGALSGGGDLSANRTLDVANSGITNAKLADVPSPSFKGRSALGTGPPTDLSPSQVAAYLPDFAPGYVKGVVTGPATATGKYLKDDGTWAVPTGGSFQPLDTDLTTIAGLTATTDNIIQSVGSAWASRTPAQVKSTLALTKSDVGLGSVDNTSDAGKPLSSAQQSYIDTQLAQRALGIVAQGAAWWTSGVAIYENQQLTSTLDWVSLVGRRYRLRFQIVMYGGGATLYLYSGGGFTGVTGLAVWLAR